MSRIRTIKPEFFTSSDVVALTPLARLFYVSLWCEADREGRMKWNPQTLKLRYFPADDCDINELVNELLQLGLVELYEVGNVQYAEIPSFTVHQVINNREAESIIPPRVKEACKRVSAEGRKEGKEGKGIRVINDDFVEFWNAYPNKVAKPAALKAWNKVDVPLQTILESLSRHCSSEQWSRDNGKFIPHPATWLNQRRWEDHSGPSGDNSLFKGAL